MLINYIKAAFASWYRRKMFTSLTLVAMAFSIIILTCVATYWALLNTPLPPESSKKQLKIVTPNVLRTDQNNNTSLPWFDISEIKNEQWKNYDYSKMGIERHTSFMGFGNKSLRINSNNYESRHKMMQTDDQFFRVFDFSFIAGSAYENSVITDEGIPVIIVQGLAEKYFGTTECVGKSFTGDGMKLFVKGVVEPPGPWSLFYQYEVFKVKNFKGTSDAISIAFIPANKSEEALLVRRCDELSKQLSASIEGHVITFIIEDFIDAYATIRKLYLFLQPILFMPIVIIIILLPATCMFNLFRSMVAERTEEIGIRKSFGAHAGHIARQFIVESILITLIAGVIAMLFSLFFWIFLLEVDLGVVVNDIFTWRVMAFCMLAFLFTGSIVGYFSSLKLAKGQVVKYLSSNPS